MKSETVSLREEDSRSREMSSLLVTIFRQLPMSKITKVLPSVRLTRVSLLRLYVDHDARCSRLYFKMLFSKAS